MTINRNKVVGNILVLVLIFVLLYFLVRIFDSTGRLMAEYWKEELMKEMFTCSGDHCTINLKTIDTNVKKYLNPCE